MEYTIEICVGCVKSCRLCNTRWKSNNGNKKFATLLHYINNYYKKRIESDFDGVFIQDKALYVCINCSINYYNWYKKKGKDRLRQVLTRQIYGSNRRVVKIRKINKLRKDSCVICKRSLSNTVLNRREVVTSSSFCNGCFKKLNL